MKYGSKYELQSEQSRHSGTVKTRKLPPSSSKYIMPLILTFLMTFVVAGISTWIAVGALNAFFVKSWAKSWMVSWVIAFPAMVALTPVTNRLVALIVRVER